jgi:ParB-like chromosome segregation protein Spo0J
VTSGEFKSVPLSFIRVNRNERQRKELKNIEELAASIARRGLIHPPVIERDGTLRTGERRFTAVRFLGWSHIPVQFADELSHAEAQALELEENIARVDIEWQEECLAIAKYHALMLDIDPAWEPAKTADALGYGIQSINDKLRVAKELVGGNERVTAAPKYSVARGITQRNATRAAANAIEAVTSTGLVAEAAPQAARRAPLLNEDFHEWSAAYTGPRFNFIHCDFPYGVGADNHDQGQAAAMGGYDDSPDVYWALLDTLRLAMDNVVADSAHLMFWFSMDYYHETQQRLGQMGWQVNPFPLIWFKDDNTGILPDPTRGPRRVYETAFLASRGDRPIVRAKSNVFAHPGKDKSIHMSEKPVPMLKHFMEMFVDGYSRVLDPTAGSANALKAATALGAPTVLGLERDLEFFTRSTEAYFQGDDLDDIAV